jgi:hypothetical protein
LCFQHKRVHHFGDTAKSSVTPNPRPARNTRTGRRATPPERKSAPTQARRSGQGDRLNRRASKKALFTLREASFLNLWAFKRSPVDFQRVIAGNLRFGLGIIAYIFMESPPCPSPHPARHPFPRWGGVAARHDRARRDGAGETGEQGPETCCAAFQTFHSQAQRHDCGTTGGGRFRLLTEPPPLSQPVGTINAVSVRATAPPFRSRLLDLPEPATPIAFWNWGRFPVKLNLGCGRRKLDGWLNADRSPLCQPDQIVDLERTPWPWPDGTADEVMLSHVLEHLGATTAGYFAIIQELWRICRNGAAVTIVVPHPRHDDFLHDPTHVRAVTSEGLSMFSQALNREWLDKGLANSPLGIELGVDFTVRSTTHSLDEPWRSRFVAGELTKDDVKEAIQRHLNVVKETTIVLVAVKPTPPNTGDAA